MSSIKASDDMSQVPPEQLQRFLDILAKDIVSTVNGKLDFQTNFNCTLISVPFTAANTQQAILHGLGRVPVGYIKTRASANMEVFDGTSGNTSNVLYLQASAPGTVGLLIY